MIYGVISEARVWSWRGKGGENLKDVFWMMEGEEMGLRFGMWDAEFERLGVGLLGYRIRIACSESETICNPSG